MKPTSEILERIYKNASDHKDGVYTRLYRYLLREDIYFIAYQKIYSNKGATTKGVDDDTADGFGKKYVDGLINDLKNGTYKPKPARRIYIPKANGKERPLSIPSFRDKLLQEVIRMFLEAIYEPNFSDFSHGFRPNRSCHTALKQAKIYFTGAKWFVEGDIKGCFDNIDHDKLIEILQRKIKDSKFINVIRLMLKAGYVEDFKYHETYSGTPQGGILSPILANIYLNELDMKLEEIQNRFKKPHERKYTYEYSVMKGRRDYQKAKLKKAKEDEKAEILDRIEEYTKALYGISRTPADDKNLYFVRYADDFLIAVKGSKEDCIAIKAELTEFLKKELKLTLSEEKTLITHSSKKALFLGYNVSVRRSNVIKQNGQGYKQRTLNNKVELSIPFERIEKFMFDRGIIRQTESKKFKPIHRKGWLYLPDYVIVQRYNEEMRGVLNYYNLAVDYNRLGYFRYLMEYSCLATLAGKHNSSISKIARQHRKGKYWSVTYITNSGIEKEKRLVTLKDCQNGKCNDAITKHRYIPVTNASIRARLATGVCELCGKKTDEPMEVHLIPSIKTLQGEELWKQIMRNKRRKTLVVCSDCHKTIHE
ncbi:MAG: reverse transcriptase domain-containing protein [Lachnospiraceae bacterium]